MKTLAELRKRFDEIGTEIRAVLDSAENGVLSKEDREKVESLREERKGVLQNIEVRTELAAEERSAPKPEKEVRGGPEAATDPEKRTSVEVGADRHVEGGFRSFGEQLRAVAHAAQQGVEPDQRLFHLHAEHRAATGQSEAVAADGGFLVQKDFTAEILEEVFETGEIISRVSERVVGPNSNGLKLNQVDSDSRADGQRYGGLQAYWLAEAAAFQASKREFRRVEMELHKVGALVYSTDELLQDAAALESDIRATVPEEIRFTVEEAIVNGNGVGKPLGFTQTPAYVSVAKESGQAGDSVVAGNVSHMWGRMRPGSFRNAVFLVDQTVLAHLPLMTIGDQPVWTSPGMLKDAPNGALFGRPVVPHEHGVPVGEPGDIILADLPSYILATKGGVRADASMHVRFLSDELAFRFTWRVDGQPRHLEALTPKSNGATQSSFVTVASRT